VTEQHTTERPPSTGEHIRIVPSNKHVTVVVDGVVIADSTRPTFLYEGNHPVRTYLPKDDVRMDLLVPTDKSTSCPFKGAAEYWTVRLPSGDHADVAWSYREPIPDAVAIAGLLAFYDDRVTLTVDGQEA